MGARGLSSACGSPRRERVGGFGGRADLLNYYNTYTGDPARINTDIDRYRTVSTDDIKRAASSALGDNYVRLTVLPEEQLTPAKVSVDRSVMPEAPSAPVFDPPLPARTGVHRAMSIGTGDRLDRDAALVGG